MKFLKSTTLAVSLAASCLMPMASNASINVSIASATLTQIWSATFDGLVFGQVIVDDGTFFGAVPNIGSPVFGVNRSITFTPTGGTAGGSITYDGTELDQLAVTFPDMTTSILDSATPAQVGTVGGSLNIQTIPHFDGGNDANFDAGGLLGAGSTTVIVDFSTFNDFVGGAPGVIKSCTSTVTTCSSLPALNLDGVRYTLQGTLTLAGGDALTLRVQTANASYYEVDLVTETISPLGKNVPIPAIFIYLSALTFGLLGFVRLRKQA